MPQSRDHAFIVFQSHAGSIEAGLEVLDDVRREIGFNPTLVRLRRLDRPGPPAGRGRSFNPTLVRLRRPSPRRPWTPSASFQSHAGSIEAPGQTSSRYKQSRSFNPTLVRLRLDTWRPARVAYHRFQSHAGSIEAACASGWKHEVRQFQSHAGSIEACVLQAFPNEAFIPFQSHAGSIEARDRPAHGPGPRWFQSHAGSIEAPFSALTEEADMRVSIPRWFD